MRRLLLPLLAAAVPLAAGEDIPLTLDPALYADALRAVQQERAQAPLAPAPQPSDAPATRDDAAEWCQAMQEAGTPQGEVRLILLLRRLNPAAGVEALGEALALHRLMQAGNVRACRQLAAAMRSGQLPGGLRFICSEELAQVLAERAAALQFPPGLPTGQPEQSDTQPPSEAKASGASA